MEIDDLTSSQVCDEMEAFDGLLNMSVTQTLAEYETGLDHGEFKQDWNFLGKDENVSKKPTTSPNECTDNSIALNTPAPNIPECSVFPETSATVHSEEEPMSKRPRFPYGEFKNCNITFQF